MSVITILNGDWQILFDDENNQNGGTNAVAGMRTVRHTGNSETVYTTNQLYSAVADAADDFVAMGFKNPMLPVTPNEYTMENQYFIPRSSTQYLKEGAIRADWSLVGATRGDGVLKVVYSGGNPFVSGDIGRQVVQSGTNDSGTLLDFDRDQDGSFVAWVRPDNPSDDTFSGTGSISVVADGGTGVSGTSVAGKSGEHVFAAIQAIGSVTTATSVFTIQDRQKIQGWGQDDTFQWWETDSEASLGIISILLQVKDSGDLVADGDVEIFARPYTALFDNFRLNVAGGGFSALPLASSPDINNTTGYRTVTGSSGSGSFTVGNGIYFGANFASATKRGVITAVSGSSSAPVISYYLIGDLTDFSGGESIQEYDFVTAADGDGTCTIGTPVDTVGGPTDNNAGQGGAVTVTLGHVDFDHTGDGVSEPYSITVDCNGAPISKVYEKIKYITRRGASKAELFGVGVDQPGETYRGIDTFVEYTNSTGTMTDGDNLVKDPTDGYSSRLVAQSASTSPKYITIMDTQTSIKSVSDGDNIDDESGDTIEAQSTGGGGTFGIVNVTSPKQSPFGTFTGTQIFGARGVLFTNTAGPDVQAYILTDDFGNLNSPPNSVGFTVSNTAPLDRVLVARDTGVAGVIDKDQFGGLNAASAGDSSLTVSGGVDTEVPPVGYLRVVDTTPVLSRMGRVETQQEHKYEYSSRSTGAGGSFTLTSVTNNSGSADSTSAVQLTDAGANWSTGGSPVKVGMLVRNTSTGDVWEVASVISDTALSVIQLYGSGTGGVGDAEWTSGDGYEINKVITAYGSTDLIYDLILDLEAVGATAQNSFTKTLGANFGVVVNVRQGKVILPFTLNQSQGDGTTTVTVVRQPDNIAT